FTNRETGWFIEVTAASLRHGFANRGVVNIKLIPALPELIRRAAFLETVPHEPPSREIKCVHRFVAALRCGHGFYRVKFTVKELLTKRKLYDHQSAELKKVEPGGEKSPEEANLATRFAPWPAPGSEIRVGDLVSGGNNFLFESRCQIDSPGENWTQDPDVLDTWFSSWLWPFATMGWPEKTETLSKFYPTTDLVTGPDIIFFWVARMIMAGFEFMGEMPFRNVYFTGIIRDKQGRKMSKSLGNSPDPLDLIAKYGADALRFGVMRSAPLGADVLFDEKNVELGRNFCTKLWNAARFRQMQGKDEGRRMKAEEVGPPTGATTMAAGEAAHSSSSFSLDPALLTSDDKWILLKLNGAIRDVSRALDEYRFSDAAQALHRFFWSEFCDWYLEAAKAALGRAGVPPADSGVSPESHEKPLREDSVAAPESANETPTLADARKANTLAVLDFVLAHTLRLFHPFLPFITEELWHGLGYSADLPDDQGGRTIMTAHWPAAFGNEFFHHYDLDPSQAEFAEAKYETVNHGRALRRDFNIASSKRVRFVLRTANPPSAHDCDVLRLLLHADPLEIVEPNWTAPKGTPAAPTPLGELLLPLEGLVDVAAERERLAKEIAKVDAELAKVRAKLADPNFAGKVPAKVLDEHQQRERDWAEKHAQLTKMRAALG
ncbi:MAG TPA: class I tRNA ligase family protein, partial [Chthoniobacteraceae bacterium]|nr:class I tRNA ligase family protein [Chthoniobacteraceae bacterium]